MGLGGAAIAGETIQPATGHGPQQVLMRRIVALGKRLVVRQFRLHHLELLLRDNGRNLPYSIHSSQEVSCELLRRPRGCKGERRWRLGTARSRPAYTVPV